MSTPLRERPDAPLGTLIFRAGLLPAETIESALEEGVKTGKRLGEILTERGLLKEADLARLLAGQRGLEFLTLREQIVDPAAAGLFTEDQARLFRALPFAFEDGVPLVAIADPTDDVLTRNIREALGREDARFVVSVRSELAEIIGQVYAGNLAATPPPPAAEASPVPAAAEEPAFVSEPVPAPEPATEAPAAEPVHTEAPSAEPVEQAPFLEPVAEAPVAPQPVAEAPAPQAQEEPETPPAEPVLEAAPAAVEQPAEPLPSQVPYADAFPEQPVYTNGSGAPEHAGLNGGEQHEPMPAAPDAAAPPEPPAAPETVQPLVQAEPAPVQPLVQAEVEREPVQPLVQPAPEAVQPLAQPQPAAAAAAVEQPVAPAPEPAPPVAAAQEPGAPEAPAEGAATAYHLSVRLTNGERVEAGSYADLETAKQQAKALMAQVAAADDGDWPFVSGRFLKPDTIVSVDIV